MAKVLGVGGVFFRALSWRAGRPTMAYGVFGWLMDPAEVRVELWEPPPR